MTQPSQSIAVTKQDRERMRKLADPGPCGWTDHEWGWYQDDVPVLLDALEATEAAVRAWRDDAMRVKDALRELHRAITEDDLSDCDDARLQDAIKRAQAMAPYVPDPPDPNGF